MHNRMTSSLSSFFMAALLALPLCGLSSRAQADPAVVDAIYDEYANTLTLYFNEQVEAGPGGLMGLSVDNGTSEYIDFSFSPEEVLIHDGGLGVDLLLSETDAAYIESWATVSTNLELQIEDGTFYAVEPDYLPNPLLTYEDNFHVTYAGADAKVIAANYDAYTNILSLTFNRDMMPGCSGTIDLSVDDGSSLNFSTSLSNGSLQADGRTFSFVLSNPGFESWPLAQLRNNLEIQLPAAIFCWMDGASQAQTFSDNVRVSYIEEAPMVIAAAYDDYTHILYLTFNRDMFAQLGAVVFSVNDGMSTQSRNPVGILLQDNGRTLALDLGDYDEFIPGATPEQLRDNLEVQLNAGIFHAPPPLNMGNQQQLFSDNVHVEFIEKAPKVIAASYDAYTNTVSLTFNRDMQNAPVWSNLELSIDNGFNYIESLNDAEGVLQADGRTYAFTYDFISDLENWPIELLQGALELHIYPDYFMAAPELSLGNIEQTFTDDLRVEYIQEDAKIVAANYDAYTNTLSLTFNRAMLPGCGVVADLSIDNGINVTSVGLNNNGVLQADGRTLTFVLNEGMGNPDFESWSLAQLHSNLEIQVSPGAFCWVDGASLGQGFNNNVRVEYIEEAPKVIAATYDDYTHILNLTFNRDMAAQGNAVFFSVNEGMSWQSWSPVEVLLLDDKRTLAMYLNSYAYEEFLLGATPEQLRSNLEVQLNAGDFHAAPPLNLANQQQLFSDNVRVEFIEKAPKVIAASYDAYTDTLNLTFNRDMQNAPVWTNLEFSIDNGFELVETTSGAEGVLQADGRTYAFTFDFEEPRLENDWPIELLRSALELHIYANDFMAASELSLGNIEQTFADNVHVEYIQEDAKMVAANYDAYTNTLYLTFNRDMLPGCGVVADLSVDNGINFTSVGLNNSGVLQADGRTLAFVLNAGFGNPDFESWSLEQLRSNLEIRVTPGDFCWVQGASLEQNFNDNVRVEYIEEAPKVIAASYDAYTDQLTLTFNRDMGTFSACCDMELSIDNGTNVSNFHPGAAVLLDDGRTFVLDSDGAVDFEAWPIEKLRNNLELKISSASFASLLPEGIPNLQQTFNDNLRVEYIEEEPKVMAASYDAYTDQLHLTFNRAMQSATNLEFICLSVNNGTDEVCPNMDSVVLEDDMQTLTLTLHEMDAYDLENYWPIEALRNKLEVMLFGENFFSEEPLGFMNQQQTYADNVRVHYIEEEPVVIAAHYDAYTNRLNLTFNRDMLQGCSGWMEFSVDNGQTLNTSIGANNCVLQDDGRTLSVVLFGNPDFESWPIAKLRNNLEIQIQQGSFLSTLGSNLAQKFTDNVRVTYIEEAPKVIAADYDAYTNKLRLTFNRDMNPEWCCDIALSVDNGGGVYNVQVAGSVLLDDKRTFEIGTGSGHIGFEDWPIELLRNNLELRLLADQFYAAAPLNVGNQAQTFSANVRVHYIEEAPKVIAASYDSYTNLLYLTFNRDMVLIEYSAPPQVCFTVKDGLPYSYGWEDCIYAETVELQEDGRTVSLLLKGHYGDDPDFENWELEELQTKLELQLGQGGEFTAAAPLNLPSQVQLYTDNVRVTYIEEAPTVTAASYDSYTNILSLTFNREMMLSSEEVELSIDNGNMFNERVFAQLLEPLGTGYTLLLKLADDPDFETWPIEALRNTLELFLPVNHFYAAPPLNLPAKETLYGDNVRIEYIEAAPKVVAASYDGYTHKLRVTFNRVMSAEPSCCGVISLSVDNGLNRNNIPSNMSVLQADGRTYELDITAFPNPEFWTSVQLHKNLELAIDSGAFNAVAPINQANIAQSFAANVSVQYIDEAPKIIAASYDADNDTFSLTFNRDMADNEPYSESLEVSIGKDDHGDYYNDFMDIDSAILQSDQRTYLVKVDNNDFESWPIDKLHKNLELLIQPDIFYAAAPLDLGNLLQTYADHVRVKYIAAEPTVVAAAYYTYLDQLELEFNRNLDDSDFYGGHGGLSVDDGWSENVSFSWLVDVDGAVNDRVIKLALDANTAETVEAWPTLASKLEVELLAMVVRSVSGYSNEQIDYSDNVVVEVFFANGDNDGDGVVNLNDAMPRNPAESVDTDNDGVGNNADSDDDNDLMPDSWEVANGLNPLLDDADADTDGDGYTNYEEYIDETNPLDGNAHPRVSVKNDYNHDGIAGWIWLGDSNGVETQSQSWQLSFPLYSNNWAIPNRFYHPVFQDQANWEIMTTGDFDKDGDADILWRNLTTAAWKIWQMQDGLRVAQTNWSEIFDPSYQWQVVGVGDTDRDGDDDVILNMASTGEVLIWVMQNDAVVASHYIGTKPGYTLNRIGDFNKDGDVDLLLRQNGGDALIIWELQQNTFVAERALANTGAGYNPVCAADFDKDGDDDIMLVNSTTQQEKWFMMENYTRTQQFGGTNTGFVLLGCGDYDGDGDADSLWQRSVDQLNRVVLQQNWGATKQTVYTNAFGGANGFVYRGNSN